MADKAPDSYPTDELLRMKAQRANAVRRAGGTPVLTSREDCRRAAQRLLRRNRLLFTQYGPDPTDGSTESAEAAAVWSRRVREEIIPNNRVLAALVELNDDLATSDELDVAELLRQHTDDLEAKHRDGQVLGPAARFPSGAEDLFKEDEVGA